MHSFRARKLTLRIFRFTFCRGRKGNRGYRLSTGLFLRFGFCFERLFVMLHRGRRPKFDRIHGYTCYSVWTRENTAHNTCWCWLEQHLEGTRRRLVVSGLAVMLVFRAPTSSSIMFYNGSTCIMVTLSLSLNFGCAKITGGKKASVAFSTRTHARCYSFSHGAFIHSLTHSMDMC